MKKILLILISIYSFSFAVSNPTCSTFQLTGSSSSFVTSGSYNGVGDFDWVYNSSGDYYSRKIAMSSTPYQSQGGVYYYKARIVYGVCYTLSSVLPTVRPFSDEGSGMCQNINGEVICKYNPSNGAYDDNGDLTCNGGYSSVGNSQCFENPSNGGYDDNGDLTCNDGYYKTGSTTMTNMCMNTPYTPEANDGSCPSGWSSSTSLITGNTVCNPPDSGSTGGDSGSGSTGGDSGSGSTGGDSGSSSTGGDSGSGSTGGDSGSTGGTATGGGTGTGGSDGTGTNAEDGTPTGAAGEYMCPDGGKSVKLEGSKIYTCDRTCEQAGLQKDSFSDKCIPNEECPEGQTKTGFNAFTNKPFCYDLTDPKTENTLLAKIADNTTTNKNSNTQLGNINNNIISTNGKLEAVKGGLSIINTSINNNLKEINNDKFSNTDNLNDLSTMSNDTDSFLSQANQAFINVTTTFDSIKQNYQDLKDFIDGKEAQEATINISAVTLQKKTYTVFGKTVQMDCFFNQDLESLFAPISPFITFLLNIYFVYLSISLFMKYALANRGGIV